MKTCILTIVKNEHLYLDEWIRYHLELGIDHIFIYEDYDSESHKTITDKYDEVTLSSILELFTPLELEIVKQIKITKCRNPQSIYMRKALVKIKRLETYDWCFVIDDDEFITLTNNSLHDTISLYEDYDAFLLEWKLYGADGHVEKPEKGVVESYIEERDLLPFMIPQFHTKACYNMFKYKNIYYKSIHYPSVKCNWSKTDYTKDLEKPSYDNIYLRHYITKSWEEFKWKTESRGFFIGKSRNTNMFFELNKEMNDLKELLLQDEILVVLPYKQSGSQGKEIRTALSLWQKLCKFKYHFIVIGEYDNMLPVEFPDVEFIHCPSLPKREGQYNPHLDILHKFQVVESMYSSKYRGFIYTCDDYYAIKPFGIEDVATVFYHSQSFTGQQDKPASWWTHDKWKTRQLLDKHNLPHINYTTHHPYYMDFSKLNHIIMKFNMNEESYVFDDVYFNYYRHSEPILDDNIRLGIWNYTIYKTKLRDAIANPKIKFVCNSVEGYSKDLEDDLIKLYNRYNEDKSD